MHCRRRKSSVIIMESEEKTAAKEPCSAPSNIVTISATVTTGFEFLANEECLEKLHSKARTRKGYRGRIFFEIPIQQVEQTAELRSVENLKVIVADITDVDLHQEKEKVIADLCQRIGEGRWRLALDTWKLFTNSDLCLPRLPQNNSAVTTPEQNTETDSSRTDKRLPTFRVTCTRSGQTHQFNSRDVAPAVGDQVSGMFGWPVKLKDFDIEVVVNVLEDSTLVALSLTKESLFKRNIAHFGPTTLKSTICYCMMRMAQPKPGEVICDPMCGGDSIPIEGLFSWQSSYFLAGDIHELGVDRAKANVDALTDQRKNSGVKRPDLAHDILQWDVTNLPLRSSSVDVMVSDLPFGKRMGSRRNNWSLYHRCLEELARVCVPGTSRAVLLTQDKKCMQQTIARCHHLWVRKKTIQINHGGLKSNVYFLKRQKKKDSKGKDRVKQEEEEEDDEEAAAEEEEEAAKEEVVI